MRGQSLACSVVDTSPLAPRRGFYPASDRCARARLPFLPARSHCLGTAFPLPFGSPATTVLFREPPRRGRSSWPIPSALIPNLSSSPFGLELPPSAPFFTSPGAFLAQNPLPVYKPETLKRPSNFRFPSGLSSLRIRALGQRLSLRSLPLCPARFSFAPRQR